MQIINFGTAIDNGRIIKDMWQLMDEFFRTKYNKYQVAINGDNECLLTDEEKKNLIILF